MGSVSVSVTEHGVSNNERWTEATVTPSASYATGGDTLPLTSLRLKEVSKVHTVGEAGANKSGLSVELAGTRQVPLLKFFDSDNTEVTNTTNLSARQTLKLRIYGV